MNQNQKTTTVLMSDALSSQAKRITSVQQAVLANQVLAAAGGALSDGNELLHAIGLAPLALMKTSDKKPAGIQGILQEPWLWGLGGIALLFLINQNPKIIQDLRNSLTGRGGNSIGGGESKMTALSVDFLASLTPAQKVAFLIGLPASQRAAAMAGLSADQKTALLAAIPADKRAALLDGLPADQQLVLVVGMLASQSPSSPAVQPKSRPSPRAKKKK